MGAVVDNFQTVYCLKFALRKVPEETGKTFFSHPKSLTTKDAEASFWRACRSSSDLTGSFFHTLKMADTGSASDDGSAMPNRYF